MCIKITLADNSYFWTYSAIIVTDGKLNVMDTDAKTMRILDITEIKTLEAELY